METGQTNGANGNEGVREASEVVVVPAEVEANRWEINREMFRRFFGFTGGSIFYCVSAVLVAYGVAKVLGPVLSDTDTIRAVLPCLLTLGVYELALLGVLVLIVSRKVVDDAISVAIIMAIYMVATSIALGSVAERNLAGAVLPAVIGVALGFVKVWAMRRYGRIPFGVLSTIGLVGLIAVSCFGPMVVAQTIGEDAAAEWVRRSRWFMVWGAMLLTAGLVWFEAVRSKAKQRIEGGDAFLQSPAMVYVLAAVVLGASAVHQNATAYMFAIGRPFGDFVPAIGVGSLIVLEILRRSKLQWGVLHIAVVCVALGAMGWAIYDGSVASLGGLGFDIVAYPPVFFAVMGAVLTWLSSRYGRRSLLMVALVCLFGVFLTVGFSPEEPWDLNYRAAGALVVVGLVVCGLVSWNYFLCIAAIPLICIGVGISDGLGEMAEAWGLSQLGMMFGIVGVATVGLYLLFGDVFARAIRIFGALCLALFVYDYLPAHVGGRYAIVLLAGALLAAGLWLRVKDWVVIVILAVPVLVRVHMLAKQIANWRFVILGFVALAVGTFISLKKPKALVETERIDES